jgi:hypothetical protein
MTDRDDRNILQFRARSQQPKAQENVLPQDYTPSPVNVAIIFDSPLGSISDELETLKFRGYNTPLPVTQTTWSSSRHNGYACMKSSYYNN